VTGGAPCEAAPPVVERAIDAPGTTDTDGYRL
jgi:hypothetical protein